LKKYKNNFAALSTLHHLISSRLKLIGGCLIGSKLVVVRLSNYSKIASFTSSRSTGKRNSTNNVVIVFLLRIEINSLNIGVRITSSLCLDTVTDETESMVSDAFFGRTSLHSHLLVAGNRHHTLVLRLSMETTT